ncbi:MAG: hypothetical protein ACE5H0_13645 [Bacteroidota bacterium]
MDEDRRPKEQGSVAGKEVYPDEVITEQEKKIKPDFHRHRLFFDWMRELDERKR